MDLKTQSEEIGIERKEKRKFVEKMLK